MSLIFRYVHYPRRNLCFCFFLLTFKEQGGFLRMRIWKRKKIQKERNLLHIFLAKCLSRYSGAELRLYARWGDSFSSRLKDLNRWNLKASSHCTILSVFSALSYQIPFVIDFQRDCTVNNFLFPLNTSSLFLGTSKAAQRDQRFVFLRKDFLLSLIGFPATKIKLERERERVSRR